MQNTQDAQARGGHASARGWPRWYAPPAPSVGEPALCNPRLSVGLGRGSSLSAPALVHSSSTPNRLPPYLSFPFRHDLPRPPPLMQPLWLPAISSCADLPRASSNCDNTIAAFAIGPPGDLSTMAGVYEWRARRVILKLLFPSSSLPTCLVLSCTAIDAVHQV